MTEFLKEALNATFNGTQEEKLKALQRAYLTHRQVGFSEAVYRAIKSMWLKGSNVCFVPNHIFGPNENNVTIPFCCEAAKCLTIQD